MKPSFFKNLGPHDLSTIKSEINCTADNKKNAEYYEKIKDDMKKNEEIKVNEAKKLMDNIKKPMDNNNCILS